MCFLNKKNVIAAKKKWAFWSIFGNGLGFLWQFSNITYEYFRQIDMEIFVALSLLKHLTVSFITK